MANLKWLYTVAFFSFIFYSCIKIDEAKNMKVYRIENLRTGVIHSEKIHLPLRRSNDGDYYIRLRGELYAVILDSCIK